MRQSLWLGPWDDGAEAPESVADFVVPPPLPDALLYVVAPWAERLSEPTPGARVLARHGQSEALTVLRAAPWLPEDFVAVFEAGRVTGFLRREALSAHKPAMLALLAECRAALARLDVERAQALAQAVSDLYEHGPALDLVMVLLGAETGWQPEEFTSPSGELRAPGAHVVPGATVYVGAPELPRVKTRDVTQEPDVMLPINTPVLVLDVDGGWARVQEVPSPRWDGVIQRDGTPEWRARSGSGELEDGERPEVGYVLAHYLEPAPVDPRALREQARALREAGSGAQALALLERAHAAEPWERETQREVLAQALELDGLVLAGRAAVALSRPGAEPEVVRFEAEGVTEDLVVPARPEETPVLKVRLLYGCRGDVTRAEALEESTVGEEDPDAGNFLADACITAVDAQPPEEPPAYADCTGLGMDYQDEQMQEERERKDREAEELRRKYEEETLPAFKARLTRLRERFPQGPFFCVDIENPAPLARVNLRVQYSELPLLQEDVCEVTARTVRGTESLRVGEFVVPYLAPGASTGVCIEVSAYENVEYGAMLAPDVKAAAAFVHRLAVAQDDVLGRYPSEVTQALASLLPYESVTAEFPETCNHACY
jgi:tetratricopeptide (TPR) repeat protein